MNEASQGIYISMVHAFPVGSATSDWFYPSTDPVCVPRGWVEAIEPERIVGIGRIPRSLRGHQTEYVGPDGHKFGFARNAWTIIFLDGDTFAVSSQSRATILANMCGLRGRWRGLNAADMIAHRDETTNSITISHQTVDGNWVTRDLFVGTVSPKGFFQMTRSREPIEIPQSVKAEVAAAAPYSEPSKFDRLLWGMVLTCRSFAALSRSMIRGRNNSNGKARPGFCPA